MAMKEYFTFVKALEPDHHHPILLNFMQWTPTFWMTVLPYFHLWGIESTYSNPCRKSVIEVLKELNNCEKRLDECVEIQDRYVEKYIRFIVGGFSFFDRFYNITPLHLSCLVHFLVT